MKYKGQDDVFTCMNDIQTENIMSFVVDICYFYIPSLTSDIIQWLQNKLVDNNVSSIEDTSQK